MKARRRALLRAVAILPLGIASAAFAQDPRVSIVANVAREWLERVDRGDVAGSYARAGARFRKALTETAWTGAYDAERKPRGAVVQRALAGTRFESRAPGSSIEGEFAFLAYRTSFDKVAGITETITLERESDGAWRVVGYSIR
ncbi:MAG TPA: DUF4019 domain-containing protein [Casimicrobiaceae bacterium]|nr:DUF4019 domain-containing protein [Casimicrobiaceae bacterium]